MPKLLGWGKQKGADKGYPKFAKQSKTPSGVKSSVESNGVTQHKFLKRSDMHTDECIECNDNSLTERCICNREEKDRMGNPKGTRYDIVRFFSNENRKPRIIHRDVSDVVARLHVNDPRTRKEGVYFDAFRKRS